MKEKGGRRFNCREQRCLVGAEAAHAVLRELEVAVGVGLAAVAIGVGVRVAVHGSRLAIGDG